MPTPSQAVPAIQVARINARQVVIVTCITCTSGLLGALLQTQVITPHLAARATREGQTDRALPSRTPDHAALLTAIADEIERELLLATWDTARDDARTRARRFRALQRAVFLALGAISFDERQLDEAIELLVMRGHLWLLDERPRLLADWDDVRDERQRWLAQVAIPLAVRSESRTTASRLRRVSAPLPLSLRVNDPTPSADQVPLAPLPMLQRELERLQRADRHERSARQRRRG